MEGQKSGQKRYQDRRTSSRKKEELGKPRKLQEPWEGPFIAKETSMPGAFRLLSQTSEELPYSWNADSLKRLARFIFCLASRS
jgi:hypothetical protein